MVTARRLATFVSLSLGARALRATPAGWATAEEVGRPYPLPAPGRPEHSHRAHRRRPGRAGGRRKGPAHRPVRGRARNDPPRPRCAPGHRAADRVLTVDP